MTPGEEIAIRIDQTLTQDATGTLVMLALESLGLDRAQTEVSAQYVDHNPLQTDFKNADDHLFLASACRRFGLLYSRPGEGVSHPVHMQRLGVPGRSLLGADSHTCAAGSLGMLAIGAGGLDVALAIAGQPYRFKMPQIWGVRLDGALADGVSAKDVILELLRRHGVSGGLGRIIEYHGPGLVGLSAMDRHVIANMGAELGATTTVFPSDERTREFLDWQGRGHTFVPLQADSEAGYDLETQIDLSQLEPLIARPSSPGNVVPVREVVGEPIYQAYIGSSANPGFRDFAVAAAMVRGRQIPAEVSFDVNPSSRQLLQLLSRDGALEDLIAAGARIHQAGCNGCIGMGQAPATGRNSLRTVPRNFSGRSGTPEDSVWLCSPETATASALAGAIADPRELEVWPLHITDPPPLRLLTGLRKPPPPELARQVELVKGPNIATMPELDELPQRLELEILLVVGDDVSTDEILPAGAEILVYRSNIPKISEFAFTQVAPDYAAHAAELRDAGRLHAVVAGDNYGQGSSREHAALAPRFLGLRAVVARSFARIHVSNLINYGVLPLTCEGVELETGQQLVIPDTGGLAPNQPLRVEIDGRERELEHGLSQREIDVIRAGGRVNVMRERLETAS